MKCANDVAMKKTASQSNLMSELITKKIETQKGGKKAESFSQFMPKKPRHLNYSNVGPSWGQRKGN